MKIIDAGHIYKLNMYDDEENSFQTLTFLKRCGKRYPFNEGMYPGTNCQEVLRALIDRTEYLNRQEPCAESEAIIASLKTALFLFESRAARKHGKTLNLRDLNCTLDYPLCDNCGHIDCGCRK